MSECPPIVLSGISPDRYGELLQTAQAQGLALVGESGSTNYQGMEFSWNYDAGAQELTIQCTDKPIFIPCSMIESRIRGLVS